MKAQFDAALPSPSSARLPKKWPHSVSEGDSTVKIYRESTVISGTTYPSYLVSYFANGKRQRRRFADFTKASSEAQKIAEQKAQGAVGAGALTAAFIAEENIETNDFGASAPGPATSPDASWKYPLPPGTVACAVK